MKLMRNPVVVGVLALVAVGLVVNSLRPAFRRGARVVRVPPLAPAPAPATLARSTPPSAAARPTNSATATTGAMPALGTNRTASLSDQPGIDLAAIQSNTPRWALGARDPFQIRSIPAKPVYQRAMEILTLGGIWRQTDSSLAVLNGRIYAAGDTVLRFVIKSIEPDRVWVQGPNGREEVFFKSSFSQSTNATNTVSQTIPAPSTPDDGPGAGNISRFPTSP